jgi:hypothetical protein
MEAGDHLVLLGTSEQLGALSKHAGTTARAV